MMRSLPYLMIALACSFSTLSAHECAPPKEVSDYDDMTQGLIILEGSHVVQSKSPGGEVVALEDGALFSVKEGYEPVVKQWRLGEPVTLSFEAPYPLTAKKLYLTAIKDHSYIEITLRKPPSKEGSITSQVFYVNLEEDKLYLRDPQDHETLWQVNVQDAASLANWEEGDTILVGLNDSWTKRLRGTTTLFLINYDLLANEDEAFFLPVTRLDNDYE